jgi:hypothetical protein
LKRLVERFSVGRRAEKSTFREETVARNSFLAGVEAAQGERRGTGTKIVYFPVRLAGKTLAPMTRAS